MFEEAKETQPLSTLQEIDNCKVPKEKEVQEIGGNFQHRFLWKGLTRH